MSKPIYKNSNIRNSRGKAVPLQRLGSAEDIANTVLFLASEEASYINANEIVVDGGVIHSVLMHLPRDWFVKSWLLSNNSLFKYFTID